MLRVSHPDVVFRVIGEGAERENIEAAIRDQGIRNVQVLPHQPRSSVPSLIWDSDVCLVLLRRSEVFKTVIPTKMLEFMACGRPVILGVEGQALEILDAAGGGIAIPPEDAEALATAVLSLKSNHSLCDTYGLNGQAFIREKMSRKSTALDYERLLMKLLGKEIPVSAEGLKKTAGAQ